MGTNTGIGIGIGIPFRNNALGGDNIYFPPELKARMIGVWDNYGKKNTDADRNIIKNKIPNAGGDLEILNSAYKLNSGFGEYREDFTSWIVSKEPMTVEKTDSQVHVSYIGTSYKELPMFEYSGSINNNYSLIVDIQGIPDNVIGKFIHNNGFVQEVTNGINTIKFSNSGSWYGFTFYREDNIIIGNCDITIKQIPAFEGALVTDGINDIVASIKTLEEWNIGDKGITIVSMIHQINTNTNNFITTNNIRTDNKVIGRNIVSNIEKTGIYGWYKENIQSDTINVINNILGDENDYTSHSSSSTNINPINNSKFYVQGYAVENGFAELSSVAHYWTFAVLGKATADEINLIIAKYNLDRTLRPDILCNITKQGITNDNHADFNDKLIDYSGNGRDIQMYNLAWKGGSGVAAKKFETIKDYLIPPDEGLQELTIYNEFSYKVKSIKYADRYWTVQSLNKTDVYYPITIIADKDIIWRNTLNYTDENGVKGNIRKETNVPANTPTQVFVLGFNDFDVPDNYTKVNCVAYATRKDITEFTITFIPSCKGGILLDGIEDFGKVTGMSIYKDYTFIIDRKFLNETFANQVCLASKSKVAVEGENGGAFIIDNISINAIINPYSFYKTTSLPNLNTFDKQIVFQTKYKYLDKDIAAGTATDSDTLWLGTFRDNDSRFANVAIYSLMSFPYSMSKFLIERQLKKHKLGTLYPDMVEFRPIVKSNNKWDTIEIWQGDKSLYRPTVNDDKTGIYLKKDSTIGIYVKPYVGQKVSEIVYNGVSYTDLKLNSNGFYYKVVPITKSPQKISITIEQDENYVLFNPVINSNYKYISLDFFLNNYQKKINIGDYIPKDAYLRANLYLNNNVDEPAEFTFNGVSIGYSRSITVDTAFNIGHIYNYDSPQEVNITIDEYIRYEDIVQPYPVLLRFNDENGNEVSWGGKFRVGSTITRIGSAADSNLLPNIYNIFGLLLNDNQVTSSKVIVEKTMVFKAKSAYIFDNNEPKCILSPSRLRIPNSSYKLLGYIPDISGHGNNGVINNSAYAEGSGVNEDGSYQFDGVDDFVTIPTVTGGKQVLMKVNWQSDVGAVTLYDQRLNISDYEFAIYNGTRDLDDNPVMAYQGRNNGKTYIDGILNSNIMASELKAITHNITITNELSLGINNTYPAIGSTRSNTHFAQMSLYDFMLFDEISTDDKIQELNKYVGIEAKVELPPYYWDTYGKTNSDADRDTIQQRGVAVGDYDLINYNHAYEGMSGYNGYPVVFGESKTWEAQGTKDGDKYYIYTSNANKFNITQIKISSSLFYTYIKRNGELTSGNKDIPSFNLKVTGLDYDKFYLAYYYLKSADVEVRNVINITSDGIYELPKSFASDGSLTETNSYIGLSFTRKSSEIPDIIQNVNVTIEVLPEYENGLAYDGVEDYSENVNVPALTDYTYIFKRTLLNKKYNSASIFKGSNQQSGGGAFICDYNSVEPNLLTQGYSFGAGLYVDSLNADSIVYGTRGSVNGQVITSGNNTDTEGLTIGKWRSYKQMVFYKLILYPKTISLLEINFLKNLMEKDEIIDINHPIFISNTEDESNTSQDT